MFVRALLPKWSWSCWGVPTDLTWLVEKSVSGKTRAVNYPAMAENQGKVFGKKPLEPGENGLKLTISGGEAITKFHDPKPCPLIFHGKKGQANQQKEDTWKNRQEQPYRTQQEQGPTRRDKSQTLYHFVRLDADEWHFDPPVT